MLDLRSPRWAELHHVYGSAEDVPEQLRELGEGGETALQALSALYSSICHQGSTYSASYAAIPRS